MIAIIDYDAGNIRSVEKAILSMGQEAVITRDHDEIRNADKVILPGVGNFGDAMGRIRTYGLEEDIRYVALEKKTPFMGICLGLQLLFRSSDETPGVEGLDLLPGNVVRIPAEEGLKIPHIGWNSLKFPGESRLFQGIPEDSYVYFVHSYYLKASEPSIVAATCQYGSTVMDVAVERDNIFATQFHPEKSSDVGLQIIRNFLAI
ncbi:MAG: imidazole glycerol phosphate synthase subunit HisH [Lachnospiraceae bacterium]|nr:imidazole glycerol phosphate synthase subunit HisH [Lachnospiraceae bacterium]